MTMFAVPYNLNQQGVALDGLHIIDVLFGVGINVGLVFLLYLPITWAWHRFR